MVKILQMIFISYIFNIEDRLRASASGPNGAGFDPPLCQITHRAYAESVPVNSTGFECPCGGLFEIYV